MCKVNGRNGIQALQGFYAPAHLSTSSDVASMPSAVSFPAKITSSGPELQVSDEVFAQIAADIVADGLGLREKRKREANLVRGKRHGLPTPDMGQGPSGWEVERGDLSFANQGDARHVNKRRRITESEQTGVLQAAAQKGKTRELPVRGTPAQVNKISKLGRRGLNKEILVALPRGVSPLLELGPSMSSSTPKSHKYVPQAWVEQRESRSDIEEPVGTEDVHDEEESDKQRWARLMLHEDGKWMCKGCGRRVFSDRCTLQRHCGSSVHQKLRDWRKCPLCPKQYIRQSNLNRHKDAKHPKEREGGA
jgi:Zinc finger, C2H2 type